jgi:hypothetical protein
MILHRDADTTRSHSTTIVPSPQDGQSDWARKDYTVVRDLSVGSGADRYIEDAGSGT